MKIVKLAQHHPDCEAILRIRVDDSQSVCQLGNKFGALLESVPQLLSTAKENNVNVVGISFHVGSGCKDAMAYGNALQLAKEAWDYAEAYGFNMRILDIGGGFPGSVEGWDVSFESISKVVRNGLQMWQNETVEFIAEPGRFFVERAFTLAVAVIARRSMQREQQFMYYVNDGVYGSFNCQVFDHAICHPLVLTRNGSFVYCEPDEFDTVECSVFGPTCDGLDRIHESISLPALQVGDWLAYPRMGAYTVCAASQFNGFKQSCVIYTDTHGWPTKAVWN